MSLVNPFCRSTLFLIQPPIGAPPPLTIPVNIGRYLCVIRADLRPTSLSEPFQAKSNI